MRGYTVDFDGFFYSYEHGALTAEYFFGGRCLPEFEILYITDGEGVAAVGGEHYTLKPGELLLIERGAHRALISECESGLSCHTLRFSYSALLPDTLAILEEQFYPGRRARKYDSRCLSPEAISAFSRLASAKRLPLAERSAYLRALISELVVLLSLSGGVSSEPDPASLGARVLRYIDDNICAELSLDKLAGLFFVSKHHLCRAFKENNGISVHSYLTQKRIMQAKELISHGESASSAAYKVGFGDYSAFYRAYVKLLGSSPTAEQRGEI